MENLFNCLCSALMFPPNRERFLRGEGLQLMNLMLRWAELSTSRDGACANVTDSMIEICLSVFQRKETIS